MKMVMEKIGSELKVLLASAVVSAVLVAIGLVSYDPGVFGYAVILSTFAVAIPQFLIRYRRFRDLKDMEEKLPIFLRDIIESLRSGMPFHKAIIMTGKLEYGKLSKEVRKMANQLSWGVPLDRVLDQFAARVKKSKRLFTSVKIIREAYLSGGDVVSTLDRVAENSTMLEESEKERKSLLSQYVVLMYAIAVIFIVIVVAINNLMMPIFKASSVENIGRTSAGLGLGAIGLSNPCDAYRNIAACSDLGCNICGLYKATASTVFSIDPDTMAAYYTSLFFFMSIVQAVFSGIVAGQISENSVLGGLKHSLILSGITFGAFNILVRLGLLGI